MKGLMAFGGTAPTPGGALRLAAEDAVRVRPDDPDAASRLATLYFLEGSGRTAEALLAPWVAPYHPVDDANLLYAEEPPGPQFWFGTDSQGRDILSRIIYGAQVSLSVGLISQGLNSLIGIFLGLTAGFFGRWWDDLVMGLTNIMLAIPSIIFALAVMALLGPGLLNVFVALGLMAEERNQM